MKNVYLIGMMGAGKTVTAKALADLTGKDFVDLDQMIQDETQLTINEIFKKKGEDHFRRIEKEILEEVAKKENLIVATSGGVVLNKENVEKMNQTGHVIYLSAPLQILWERVQYKQDRPLLHVPNPDSVFTKIFMERNPLYEKASGGITISTQGLTPEATAKKILDQFLYELEP